VRLGLSPYAIDIHQPLKMQIEGGPTLELGFMEEWPLVQVAIRLGYVNEALRAQAIGTLMLVNGRNGPSHPHFALANDKSTVVLCRTLALQGQSSESIWEELKTMGAQAQALRQEMAINQFINYAS
jgi:hypothetical protein